MYSKGKEEGRRKKEEGRGPKATLARKKPLFPVDIHPWVYTNDINGHDIKEKQAVVLLRITRLTAVADMASVAFRTEKRSFPKGGMARSRSHIYDKIILQLCNAKYCRDVAWNV
ncbi:hypothetical protein [Okeania sp. KiyG1]|uniref:hypothetical protein n=1 Tax=Okeania sp. KiyG1 TaxID=2720165 RepID=UPI001924BB22|nr:hypothetical protein [Okeania sp. KiyG1]